MRIFFLGFLTVTIATFTAVANLTRTTASEKFNFVVTLSFIIMVLAAQLFSYGILLYERTRLTEGGI